MTQLLIRLFIKHPSDTKDPAVRTAYGNLASLVGMACNILLCVGKLTVGTLFGSIAIMADALNNLSDASSNVVSLIGFRLASKAPDAEHPYGHARYEYLAGLVVSVTILAIGLSLGKESIGKVLHPTPVVFSWLSLGVLAVSIAVKLWMSRLNRTVGQRIASETLLSCSPPSSAALQAGTSSTASWAWRWLRSSSGRAGASSWIPSAPCWAKRPRRSWWRTSSRPSCPTPAYWACMT